MRRRRREVEERRVEQLLARLGRRITAPPEEELRAAARAAAVPRLPREGLPRQMWRPLHLRWVVAVAAALLLGSGFGFGLGTWRTPSGSAGTSFVGLGFLPAKGWTVVQSGTVGPTGTTTAIAANVSLDSDGETSDSLYARLRSLPPTGVVIVAALSPRGDERRDSSFRLRALPLRVADAVPAELPSALSAASLVSLRARAGADGYNIDARLFFGRAPSPATVAAVDQQLRRLVVAPGGVTLVVEPRVIGSTSERLTIFGSVASGRAGEKVTVQFKPCGLHPIQFRDAFETTTRPGGGFSLAELRPFNLGISGTFRAVSGDAVSAEVPVQQRASVQLTPLPSGRFQASVSAVLPFWRRHVLLQGFERRRGTWISLRRLVLGEQRGGGSGPQPPFQSVPQVSVGTAPFRPSVPKGTTIRAVFPLAQARPCYLAGYSQLRRT